MNRSKAEEEGHRFLSSALARTATLDLTNFSALTSLLAKSLSRKLIYIKQNHFYFYTTITKFNISALTTLEQ